MVMVVVIFSVLLILITLPHVTRGNNFIDGFSEIAFCIIHIIVRFLASDDEKAEMSGDDRIKLGWVIIALSAAVIAAELGLIFYEYYKVLKKIINICKQWRGSKKGKGLQKRSSNIRTGVYSLGRLKKSSNLGTSSRASLSGL